MFMAYAEELQEEEREGHKYIRKGGDWNEKGKEWKVWQVKGGMPQRHQGVLCIFIMYDTIPQ